MEKVANRFAAELLMPAFLFDPRVARIERLTHGALTTLAQDFRVSRTAAAIRAIERGNAPAVIVCHTRAGRKWFVRSPSVPDRWWPKKEMSAESSAFPVQFGDRAEDLRGRKVRGGVWFSDRDADRFMVREETIRVGHEETLTLIVLDDPTMLAD